MTPRGASDRARDRLQQMALVARHGGVTMSGVEHDAWPEALVALYQDEYLTLVRMSASMLGSTAEAEEVVQDAVMTLRSRWSHVAEPRAYLRRSVVNGCIGVLRRRTAAATFRPDPPPPEAARQLVELRDVLLRLPDRQRAAVVLRFVSGWSDEDIAGVLGVRRSTVRSLVARGLTALRVGLEGGAR